MEGFSLVNIGLLDYIENFWMNHNCLKNANSPNMPIIVKKEYYNQGLRVIGAHIDRGLRSITTEIPQKYCTFAICVYIMLLCWRHWTEIMGDGPIVNVHGGKRKGAGRPMGATGLKRKVAEKCEELGLDPTKELIKIVQDKSTPLEIRARILQDIQGYVAPKLKAIEISGDLEDNGPIQIVSYAEAKAEDLESEI